MLSHLQTFKNIQYSMIPTGVNDCEKTSILFTKLSAAKRVLFIGKAYYLSF